MRLGVGGPSPGGRSLAHRAAALAATPRVLVRRRRHRDDDPAGVALLEHFWYADAVYDLLGALAERPDLLSDFDLGDDAVVFDVGAHRGEWCRPVLERSGATVHCFEPVPAAAAALAQAVTVHADRVVIHPVALGAREETVSLAVKGPGSSVHDTADHWPRVVADARDVVGVIDELDLDRIDLVKVNIEGGEYDLLDRLLDAGVVSRIGVLVIQFHQWVPGAHRRRRRIRRRLAATHELVWDHPWIWECWRPAGHRVGGVG